MRKLAKLGMIGLASVAAGGAALAAQPETQVMEVPLPDGSTAHIEYQGKVAPKVTIEPSPTSPFPGNWRSGAFPQTMDVDRILERMNRQRDAIMRRMQRLPRHRAGPGRTANVASYGNFPEGTTSVSVVSTSNGRGTCTRTTRVTSQGQGKQPKVETKVSGDCGADPAATAQPPGPLDRT